MSMCLQQKANSGPDTYFYVATRNLHGMALAGKVPKVLKRTWQRNGVPYVCYLLVLAFSSLAYLGISAGSAKILHHHRRRPNRL